MRMWIVGLVIGCAEVTPPAADTAERSDPPVVTTIDGVWRGDCEWVEKWYDKEERLFLDLALRDQDGAIAGFGVLAEYEKQWFDVEGLLVTGSLVPDGTLTLTMQQSDHDTWTFTGAWSTGQVQGRVDRLSVRRDKSVKTSPIGDCTLTPGTP